MMKKISQPKHSGKKAILRSRESAVAARKTKARSPVRKPQVSSSAAERVGKWKKIKLGNLLAPSGVERGAADDYPVLSATMAGGLVDQPSKSRKRVASSAPYRVVYKGELVVGIPIDEGTLGFQTLYPKAVVSPAYSIWKLKDPAVCYSPYLQRCLKSPDMLVEYAARRRAGVDRWRTISKDDFLSIEIPLPPIDDQKRISIILDKAQEVRNLRQEALQLVEKLVQVIFIDMFGDPATNPKGWPLCKVGDLLASANYGTSSKAGATGEWPVLRMGNITYDGGWDFSSLKFLDLSPAETLKYLVQRGDILFNRTNTKELVGKTAVYREERPMAFAGYLVRCRVNEHADPEFISAYLNSNHGKATLQAMCNSIVGMANINARQMQKITIPRPPIEVQKRFGDIVRAALCLSDEMKDARNSDDFLLSSLQHRAFRGELNLTRLPIAQEPPPRAATQDTEERPESTRSKHSAAFKAPPLIESRLRQIDKRLAANPDMRAPWSPDYFRYRILSQRLTSPFSFGDIWQALEREVDDPDYDTVKEIVYGCVADGTLKQQFDSNRSQPEIVFLLRS